jgi:DNA-binding response OmpR family regulator
VEDEKEIRDLLVLYLRKEGFQPLVAQDGEEGLSKARAEKPDLILLDILLPKMDGLELLRKIRSDREIARTPVAMLTAKGDETDRIVGLSWRGRLYPKPFSPREVVARIKAIFRRSQKAPEEMEERSSNTTDSDGRLPPRGPLQGKAVSLTSKEFRILQALLSRPAGSSPANRS